LPADGALSLSTIVRVCFAVAPSVALPGALRLSTTVSLLSTRLSSMSLILTVLLVCPGVKLIEAGLGVSL